jgi:hypothetical protein
MDVSSKCVYYLAEIIFNDKAMVFHTKKLMNGIENAENMKLKYTAWTLVKDKICPNSCGIIY